MIINIIKWHTYLSVIRGYFSIFTELSQMLPIKRKDFFKAVAKPRTKIIPWMKRHIWIRLALLRTSHIHHIIKSSRGILINLNDDCVLFTEDASTPKKLSIELPSKIPLLNHTAIVVLLTKTLAIIQTNCSPSQYKKWNKTFVLDIFPEHFSPPQRRQVEMLKVPC